MSKGNMFLGYARGKVGSVVFARRKGEQITRAHNAHPANPKTPAQIYQRMKMYAPTALYRLFAPNFFRYAFGDKKNNETDYNAYMRKNISLAPWVSRPLASEYAVIPMPAKISDGTMLSVQQFSGAFYSNLDQPTEEKTQHWGVGFNFADNSTLDNLSVAEFTENIKRLYPSLEDGDMITFVIMYGSALSIENGEVLSDGSAPLFDYTQIVLSSTDETNVSEYRLYPGWSDTGSGRPLMINFVGGTGDFASETDWRAVATLVTRKSGEVVLSSPATLILNDKAQEIYNLMRTDAYAQKGAISYGVSSDVILDPSDNI